MNSRQYIKYDTDLDILHIRNDSYELNIIAVRWFPVSQKKLKFLLKLMSLNDWDNQMFIILQDMITFLDNEADHCFSIGDTNRAKRIWKNTKYMEFYMTR